MRLQFEFSLLMVCVALAIIPPQNNLPARPAYTGDDKCLSCHEKYRPYFGTAHHLTSREATGSSIAGSFAAGKNVLKTPQRELQYVMEAKPEGFFQTGVLGTPP